MAHPCSRTLILLALALSACVGEVGPEGEDESTRDPLALPPPPFVGDPANNAVFAGDVSFWEGPISEAETECLWAAGMRHLIAGTQYAPITRQQLEMAASRGMTVDAYVYLYWNRSMKSQIDEAFATMAGLPVARMWLDIEEKPGTLGWKVLIPLIQEAVDACRAKGTLECGIYTGKGFWTTYLDNTVSFAELPLWYAIYNRKKTLSDWSTEHFGAWTKPVAKQFAEEALCGIGLDKNVMQVTAKPTVVIDRTLPPDTKQPPPAPERLYPTDGSVIVLNGYQDFVKLMSSTIPRAQQYQIAVEMWYERTKAFTTYCTWTRTQPFLKAQLVVHPALYRFRVRARNAYGWGAWSSWSSFTYGG